MRSFIAPLVVVLVGFLLPLGTPKRFRLAILDRPPLPNDWYFIRTF